jgi:ubiquitin C-terminal hydrolase
VSWYKFHVAVYWLMDRAALYDDVVSNYKLASRYRDHMISDLGMQEEKMLPLDEAARKYEMYGSSDMGNCTYVAPGIQVLFAIDTLNELHTPKFREAAGLEYSHAEALRARKANAFLGVDILMDDEFYTEVREESEESMKAARRL